MDEPEQEFCREQKLEKDAKARTSGGTLSLKIKVSNQIKWHTGVKKCSWCGCLYSRVSPFTSTMWGKRGGPCLHLISWFLPTPFFMWRSLPNKPSTDDEDRIQLTWELVSVGSDGEPRNLLFPPALGVVVRQKFHGAQVYKQLLRLIFYLMICLNL